jgi:hypothetical protein
VQVVEGKHEWLPGGEHAEQLAHGMVGAMALVRQRWCRRDRPGRRQDPRELELVERRERGRRQPAHIVVQRIDEDQNGSSTSSSDALPVSTR